MTTHHRRAAAALLCVVAGTRAFVPPAPPRPPVALGAKAKKGKKKAKTPKKSGMDWARDFEVLPYDSVGLRALATDAAGAFEGRTGKPLHASLSGAGDLPKALWAAPVAVVVAGPGDDGGVVAYANAAACEAYNATHKELIGSATDLAVTTPGGYASKYEKKLPSAATMRDAKRWDVAKMEIVDGALATSVVGAGYAFDSWLREDGRVGRPGGVVEAAPVDVGELAAAVEAQAAVVRELKEERGLGNKDPEVVEAVAELLRRKALVEAGA